RPPDAPPLPARGPTTNEPLADPNAGLLPARAGCVPRAALARSEDETDPAWTGSSTQRATVARRGDQAHGGAPGLPRRAGRRRAGPRQPGGDDVRRARPHLGHRES